MQIDIVINPFQIMEMRLVRNEVRSFMTHNTGEISVWQQLWWYVRHYLPHFIFREAVAFLFRHPETKAVMGYGLISKKDDGVYWVSGGLKAEFRGQGFG